MGENPPIATLLQLSPFGFILFWVHTFQVTYFLGTYFPGTYFSGNKFMGYILSRYKLFQVPTFPGTYRRHTFEHSRKINSNFHWMCALFITCRTSFTIGGIFAYQWMEQLFSECLRKFSDKAEATYVALFAFSILGFSEWILLGLFSWKYTSHIFYYLFSLMKIQICISAQVVQKRYFCTGWFF